ncbi:MAG: peptidoglycan DD-metalloendopeptidase family protein [Candidatus Moranbacteria bacterium]|nr:peptidoglycan DD-metalloendopeptidase family protein [Candidatus Moranbacteria bacterium]
MKNKKAFLPVFFSLTLFLGMAAYAVPFVWGEDSVSQLSDDAKKRADELQALDDKLRAQIKAYQSIIDLKNRQGATLDDQIKSLEAQAQKIELEINQNKQKAEALKDDISTLDQRVQEKTSLVEQQKKILSELMRDYQSQYSSDISPFLMTAEESTSYFNQNSWNNDIGERISELLSSIKDLREGLVDEQSALENKKKQAEALQSQLSERSDYLESTKNNKANLLNKTVAEVDKYDDLVDDLQKQRDDIENEIGDIEAGKIDTLEDLPSYKKGLLDYPVKNPRLSQGYGKTGFSKKAYASGKHNGLDFADKTGTTIMAAAKGRVVGTGDLGRYAYGRWVAIDHGNGIVTLYGHLSRISVSRGASVSQGQKIGEMGSTGYSTGTHVHFTVFSATSYELVASTKVKGLRIPVGATVNPNVYLP